MRTTGAHCAGTVPGILWSLTRAAPIGCDPSMPVLDEQALTNRPVSSSANATSDIVIFFFIYCFLVCCSTSETSPFLGFSDNMRNLAHRYSGEAAVAGVSSGK
jgi:hypothetical protein